MDIPLSILDRNIDESVFICFREQEEQTTLWSFICNARKPGHASNFTYCIRQIYKELSGLNMWFKEADFIVLLKRLGFYSFYIHYGHLALLAIFKYPLVLMSQHSSRRLLLSDPQSVLSKASPPTWKHLATVPPRMHDSQGVPSCPEELITIIQEHPMTVCFIYFCKVRSYIKAFQSLTLLASPTAIWHLSILPSQCVTSFYRTVSMATFKFPPSSFSTPSFSSFLQSILTREKLHTNTQLNISLEARISKLIAFFRSKMRRLYHNIIFLKERKLPMLVQSFSFATHTRTFVDEDGNPRHAPLPLCTHKITHFLMLFCKSVGAFNILGKRNTRIFHGNLYSFISQPMNGTVSLSELLIGLSLKEFLLPATNLSLVESKLRQHLLAYFIVYMMDFIILPSLYQTFSAVPTNVELSIRIEKPHAMIPAIFYRPVWSKYKNYLVTSTKQLEIAATYQHVCALSDYETVTMKSNTVIEETFWRCVSPGRLSFLYKHSGKMRPLCNFSFCIPQRGLSLNAFLKGVLPIIAFELEKPQKRHLQAHMATNLYQMTQNYTNWLNSVYTDTPEATVYMLTADMLTAFEKVSVPLLLQYIAHYIITENSYTVLTYREASPEKAVRTRCVALGSNQNGSISIEMLSRRLLCQEVTNTRGHSVLCPLAAKTYCREEIIKMLELHILNPLVIHEGHIYRLTSGIAQGSIVSTVLFNCYASLLHLHLLNLGIMSSRIFFYTTFVDDWMLVTTSESILNIYTKYLNSLQKYNTFFRIRYFKKISRLSNFKLIQEEDCLMEPTLKRSIDISTNSIIGELDTSIAPPMTSIKMPRYCGYIFIKSGAVVDIMKWLPSMDIKHRVEYPLSFGCHAAIIERLRYIFMKRIRDFRHYIENNMNVSINGDRSLLDIISTLYPNFDSTIAVTYIKALTCCIFYYTRSIRLSKRLIVLLKNTMCLLKNVVRRNYELQNIFTNTSRNLILRLYGHNAQIRSTLLGIIKNDNKTSSPRN